MSEFLPQPNLATDKADVITSPSRFKIPRRVAATLAALAFLVPAESALATIKKPIKKIPAIHKSKPAVGTSKLAPTTKATPKSIPTSSLPPTTSVYLTPEQRKEAALNSLIDIRIVPGTLKDTGNNGGFLHMYMALANCSIVGTTAAERVEFLMRFDPTKQDPGLVDPNDGSVNFLVGVGSETSKGSASDLNATVGGVIRINDNPLPKSIQFSITTPEGQNVYSGLLPVTPCPK